MFHVGVCCAIVSVHCSLLVTCWERADLLAAVCVVVSCVLSLSQMWPGLHQNWGRGWHREKYFTGRSGAILLLWIFYHFSALCLLYICARLFVPCSHLLGKG